MARMPYLTCALLSRRRIPTHSLFLERQGRGDFTPKREGNSTARGARRRSAMAVGASAPSSSSSSSGGGVGAAAFNPSDLSSDPPPPLLLSSNQLEHCSEALAFFKNKLKNPAKISQEFDRLQEMTLTNDEIARRCRVALQDANLRKSRYEDVLPFDDTRVVLNSSRDSKSSGNDYINASFVTFASGGRVSQFIATQGPLPETFEDFWEMIIQYHCPVIVMLTPVDNPKMMKKCADYFQAENGLRVFETTNVFTRSTRISKSSLVLRCLEVKHKELALPVLHIQYAEWPDHGVPADTASVREILKRIYHVPPDLGPIVVHCRYWKDWCILHHSQYHPKDPYR